MLVKLDHFQFVGMKTGSNASLQHVTSNKTSEQLILLLLGTPQGANDARPVNWRECFHLQIGVHLQIDL